MKILVPLKRVVDPYAKVGPTPDGTALDTAGVKHDINPFDEIAVEQAVRMKEADGSIEIVVVSIGTAECEEQLRKALAMGADSAILVETSDDMDSNMVAAELQAVVEQQQPNLVLMGKQATDSDRNQAGQMLAARLNWPQATFAAKIEVQGEALSVTRETDTGEETLKVPLPAVVTTDLRLNEPRYIPLPGIIKARSKPLEKAARAQSSTSRVILESVESPPARSAGRKVGSVDELVAALKEAGAL